MSDLWSEDFKEWLADGNSSGCNHSMWKAWQASRKKIAESLRAKEQAEWLGSRGFHAGWTGAAKFAEDSIK